MASRPVIGVAWPQKDYREALVKAGADVRVLDAARDAVAAVVAECDGVLLTGGVDVDPAEYGEPDRHSTVEVDADRDRYELALARAALAADLPLLAICRGAQVLNVAAGGSLIQDLPSQQPSALAHSVTSAKAAIAHDITVQPDTCLAVLVGPGEMAVNSRHHQSVATVAPGFVVSATAPDGVVEAIERPTASFCLGVQWHPENFWKTGEFGSIFDGLVKAAGARRRV